MHEFQGDAAAGCEGKSLTAYSLRVTRRPGSAFVLCAGRHRFWWPHVLSGAIYGDSGDSRLPWEGEHFPHEHQGEPPAWNLTGALSIKPGSAPRFRRKQDRGWRNRDSKLPLVKHSSAGRPVAAAQVTSLIYLDACDSLYTSISEADRRGLP